MDVDVRVSPINELRFCQKCEKVFTSHDIIPLCPDCRLEEARYRV